MTLYSDITPEIKSTALWYPVVTKTASYTTLANDGVILCDSTIAIFTITLISAVLFKNHCLIIKKINTGPNAITITAAAGQTIDGSASVNMSTPNLCLTLLSDGTNWRII